MQTNSIVTHYPVKPFHFQELHQPCDIVNMKNSEIQILSHIVVIGKLIPLLGVFLEQGIFGGKHFF